MPFTRIVTRKSIFREALGWRSPCQIQYAAISCGTNTDAKQFPADAQDPQDTRNEASMKYFLKVGTIALLAAVLAAAVVPGAAMAQAQTRVDAKKDWSISIRRIPGH